MGTGIITAPTQISFDGGAHYDSGRVQLTAGVGMQEQRSPGPPVQGILNALRVDAPEVFSLFVPGIVAAKTIGVWKNTRVGARSLGLVLEANLLTAPTAGDASNYWKIHAVDSASNAQDLPISANGVSHYFLNDNSGAVIAQPFVGSGGGSPSGNTLAEGMVIQPTQALTVTGLTFGASVSNFSGGSNYGTRSFRCSIVDSNANVLVSATVASTGPNAATLSVAFPISVVLTAGATYLVMYDIIDTYVAIAGVNGNASAGSDPGINVFASQTGQTAPVNYPTYNTSGGFSLNASGTATRASIAALTPAIIAAGYFARPQNSQNVGVGLTASGGTNLSGAGLLGTGGAAPFQGDVTYSLVAVGAPAAGAAGSDLNMRALLGTA